MMADPNLQGFQHDTPSPRRQPFEMPLDQRFKLRVVKLGGSLLLNRHSPRRLKSWLEVQVPMPTLLIVGGGICVDSIRKFDQRHTLDSAAAHWASIQMMEHNARTVARWSPAWRLVDIQEHFCQKHSSEQLDDRPQHGAAKTLSGACTDIALGELEPYRRAQLPNASDATVLVGLAYRWMREFGTALPQDWSVTSDAIAGHLAHCLGACELVFLKACEPPGDHLDDWSQRGGVDPVLPQVIDSDLTVLWQNLSHDLD